MKQEEIEPLAETAKRNLLAAVQNATLAGGNGGQHRTVAAEWSMIYAMLIGISRELPHAD